MKYLLDKIGMPIDVINSHRITGLVCIKCLLYYKSIMSKMPYLCFLIKK